LALPHLLQFLQPKTKKLQMNGQLNEAGDQGEINISHIESLTHVGRPPPGSAWHTIENFVLFGSSGSTERTGVPLSKYKKEYECTLHL
jgi:hypothetical protein